MKFGFCLPRSSEAQWLDVGVIVLTRTSGNIKTNLLVPVGVFMLLILMFFFVR
jgi:hypothetical protein